MLNNTLYYGTAETGPMRDSECVDGQILSTVERDEIPTEHGQSNFGCIGSSFTKDEGYGGVMVFIEKEWVWFYEKE